MSGLRLALALVLLLWISACATLEGTGSSGKVTVGQTETDLVEKLGQPQQILPNPQGGKIYVYLTPRMDQMAVMGGGAWGKPEQTHYWLDPDGKVTKVDFYPFGKRPFILPSREERAAKAPVAATQAPAPPAAAADPATLLEPNMAKDEVRQLLGRPDRTEGFSLGGKSIIIWYYPLKTLEGRAISTPLVFENNRLTGWGDSYYQRLLQKAAP